MLKSHPDPARFRRISLPFKARHPVLALGAQTKNTVCLIRGGQAWVSVLHQDLSDPDCLQAFRKDVALLLRQDPRVIAHDLHPEYASTKYALLLERQARRLIAVQHHHAHIASCMAENGLSKGRVIGVVFDGTGLGTDHTLWGAEFLVCGYGRFKRLGHLRTVALLGAEKAIREPWRVAAAWLYAVYGERFLRLRHPVVQAIPRHVWSVLRSMYRVQFNTPVASSMGRLFDAAASLVLGVGRSDSEGELAIRLEKLAARCRVRARGYSWRIRKVQGAYQIDPAPLFKEMLRDLLAKEEREVVAWRFHAAVAEMVTKMCLLLKAETGIAAVALSGGVFQNNLVRGLCLDLLYRERFRVLEQRALSCNDSGISLGQAAAACFKG